MFELLETFCSVSRKKNSSQNWFRTPKINHATFIWLHFLMPSYSWQFSIFWSWQICSTESDPKLHVKQPTSSQGIPKAFPKHGACVFRMACDNMGFFLGLLKECGRKPRGGWGVEIQNSKRDVRQKKLDTIMEPETSI